MIAEMFQALGPQHRGPVLRLVGWMVLAAGLQAGALLCLVPLLRAVLVPSAADPLRALVVLIVVALAATAVSVLVQRGAFLVGADIGRALQARLAAAVDRLPRSWFRRGRSGEVARLAGGTVTATMNVPAHFLRPLVTAVVAPVVLVGGLLVVDPVVGLVLLAGTPLLVASILLTDRMVAAADGGRHHLADTTAERVLEFVRAQPVLRAFGRLSQDRGRLGDTLVAQRAADRRLIRVAVPAVLVHELLTTAVFLVAVGVSAVRFADGATGVVELLAVLVLGLRVVDAVSAAAALAAGMRMTRRSLAQLNEVFAAARDAGHGQPAPADDGVPLPDGAPGGRPGAAVPVAFQGVSHRYGDGPDAEWAVRDVDLEVSAPGMTALVGPSGAGKTTLAMLVARTADATQGVVTVAGTDVRRFSADQLLDLVAVVPQDCVLLDGSLRHNLQVGRPRASEAELLDAVGQAGLTELVATRDGGLDAPVGPRGSMLSGGERQRVALARAVLTGAPVLVLDEVTSSLDAVHDEAITAGLRRLAETRTVVVVAHRLRSVVEADAVVVLESGRVVQRGRHDELVAVDGLYRRLWTTQQEAAGWQLVDAS
ncbi:ABC transporter ATP-binding protein [Isoptericola halotolerans]|uniref:ATP-binding cassette subfamily B protein n=1 Tax=Isoptericola halotolerans TaxID=300560 RepID=A0ABX2A9Z2_9MICO|nr:ABC transporter ATP-binding protein [Isoptericola halotolerans]NOV98671.1 ATP-binding cassette subfamily B protein [Isoptericola halotolerans]